MLWNCKGADSRSFISQIKMIINSLNLDMIVLMETRIPSHKKEPILEKLGFDKWKLVERQGFSQGYGWPRNPKWSWFKFF